MKFVLMTNPGFGNNVVAELLSSNLRPTIIVTDSPFYCEKKNPIAFFVTKMRLILTYLRNRHSIRNKYQPYFLAKKHNITIYPSQKVNSDEFAEIVKKNNIDYIFTFVFRILKPNIFSSPKYGSINCHPALLPLNRGASPSNWSILKNQKKTGITFHYINKGVDSGAIIEQYEFTLSGYETADIINQFLLSIGAILLVRLIYKLEYGLAINTHANNIGEGSYEPPFRKKHSIITKELSFSEIDTLIRASRIGPYSAIFSINTHEYEIINCVDITDAQNSLKALPYVDKNNNIILKTGDNKIACLITKKRL